MFTRHKGEVFLVIGATAFAFNGIVAKMVMQNGLSEWRMLQVRTGGAFIVLLIYVLITNYKSLRVKLSELPLLITYSLIGFALVQLGYFIAISRMHVSMALIIEFTAPIWIVLWIKYVRKSYVPKDMWTAVSLAFIGMLLLAQVWEGLTLDTIGVIAAFLDAFALATFFVLSEKLTPTRSTYSLTVFGFGISSAVLSIMFPIWNFPFDIFNQSMNLEGPLENFSAPGWTLILWIVLLGTVLPYLCVLSGIKILSASTSSVIGMLEPVLAGIFAWIWIGESWNAIQLIGGAIVIIGIYIADKTRTKVG
ncbi:MAG: DMT family transporter [Candidatus Planktophila sp.]